MKRGRQTGHHPVLLCCDRPRYERLGRETGHASVCLTCGTRSKLLTTSFGRGVTAGTPLFQPEKSAVNSALANTRANF